MSTSGGGCGSLDKATKAYMFEFQNLDWISTSVDPIVIQNKWYTPLPTTRNVKAYYLIVNQTNNGAAAETIVLELTINGTAHIYTVATGSNTPYYAFFDMDQTLGSAGTTRQLLSIDIDQSAHLETRSLQIRVRQTSVVDAVAANIEVNMIYLTLEASS